MGWYDDERWQEWRPKKKDRAANTGKGVVPWYASGTTAKGWFSGVRKAAQDYWRPKFVQPDAAALVQDGWTQSEGDDACRASPGVFEDARDAGDFFSICFEEVPTFASYTSRPVKAEFLRAVMESHQFGALRYQSKFNCASSHVAAIQLAKAYQEFRHLEQLYYAPQPKSGKQGDQQGPEGFTGQGDGQQQDGQGQSGQDQKDSQGNGLPQSLKNQIENSVDRAMENAQQEIKESRELARSFGWDSIGHGSGQGSKEDIQTFLRLYDKYSQQPWLKEMVKYAGRFIQIARARAKAKTLYGADQLGATTVGDDIGRLSAEELCALGIDEAEADILTRIANEEAHCLQLVGRAQAGKGPIIIAVDESGSMGGLRTESKFLKAAAIAMTVAWIARNQRRWVGIYSFSCSFRGTRQVILDPQNPKSRDARALADWVCHFDNGGTDDDTITRVIPEDVDKGLLGRVRGKADFLVLTDGMIDNTKDFSKTVKKMESWKKKHDIRIKLMLVGCPIPKNEKERKDYEKQLRENSTVAAVSEEISFSPELTESSEAAEAVFSLS